MKKLTQLALILTLGVSGSVLANNHQQGGFTGGTNTVGFKSDASIVTVEQAKQLNDEAWVTLRGNITQNLGDDDYIFKDSTGELKVEIDDDEWHGQTISPNDLVEISGEIDRDGNSVEIDVEHIRKIN